MTELERQLRVARLHRRTRVSSGNAGDAVSAKGSFRQCPGVSNSVSSDQTVGTRNRTISLHEFSPVLA